MRITTARLSRTRSTFKRRWRAYATQPIRKVDGEAPAPQPSVHWRLLTLELLLMRLQRPTRRDLGELVSVLAINEEMWCEDIEVIYHRTRSWGKLTR